MLSTLDVPARNRNVSNYTASALLQNPCVKTAVVAEIVKMTYGMLKKGMKPFKLFLLVIQVRLKQNSKLARRELARLRTRTVVNAEEARA
jgi:hypothetical protein